VIDPNLGASAPPPPPPPNTYAPPPFPPPPPAGYSAGSRTNGLAVASLVLGIVWLCGVGSILALVFGILALNQIKRTGEGGRGLAIAGTVLGAIGAVMLMIVIVAAAASEDPDETSIGDVETTVTTAARETPETTETTVTTAAPETTETTERETTTTEAPTTTTAPPTTTTTVDAEFSNAQQAAEQYLDFSGFSRQGLIDQLSSEYGDQYPVEVATAAVDSLNVDYNAEAVEAAESYLEFSAFSHAGLVDQLSSEYGDQFTREQAEHGATAALG
jgi:uncharacterized protein DUF4190/host cell surface-exposed lipoprotein